MTGTATIRATANGIELRQGGNTVRLYRHQILPFTDYATKWAEQLEQRKAQQP
ncbi:hypothetical protein [Brachybacterium paraconglomeratum]|uniref:hypothetical protein n=1 Tax=Brachybacterium paraconglomeratum TaxID=173362 RepID=UPI0022E55382|nr:hypothetical protein [Brachybacterium paraconglomeratum]